MLEVELDIFSGMPNPNWVLSNRQEKTLLQLLSNEPSQASSVKLSGNRYGLGYRGLVIRHIKTDDGTWDAAISKGQASFPNEFRVGIKPATSDSAADWLLKTAMRQGVVLADEIWEVVSRGVAVAPVTRGPRDPTAAIDRKRIEVPKIRADVPYKPGVEPHETWWACGSNYFTANAGVFNAPDHVLRNNCYCFASNHLADVRYALPGRRGGRPATSLTCGGVIDGLRADGWKDGCEPNALTIVMVIWPNFDYHFYRLVTGGPYWWWGHKPGGTPAKYTDDCGHAIYQYQGKGYAPNNICRGGYTEFYGYFYQNNWTAFVA
ncbi:hypothetical protein PQR46_43365 [Paraburkholderia sediminicola]|uniref:hypothetical protein n=1 Tax=Paraburkholderia sediminicola TaxID=458836 RepID=UPI0038B6B2FE